MSSSLVSRFLIIISAICCNGIVAELQGDMSLQDINQDMLNNILLQLNNMRTIIQQEFQVQNLAIKAMEMKIDNLGKQFTSLSENVNEKIQFIAEKVDLEDDILQNSLEQEFEKHRNEFLNQSKILFEKSEQDIKNYHMETMTKLSSDEMNTMPIINQTHQNIVQIATQVASEKHNLDKRLQNMLAKQSELEQVQVAFVADFVGSFITLQQAINNSQAANADTLIKIATAQIATKDALQQLAKISSELSKLNAKTATSTSSNAELLALLTKPDGALNNLILQHMKKLEVALNQCSQNRENIVKTTNASNKILEILNKPHFNHHHHRPRVPDFTPRRIHGPHTPFQQPLIAAN